MKKYADLTYADLAIKIAKMDEQERQQNVTVYVNGHDEYYPISSIETTGDFCDVLDAGSIVLFTPENCLT